MRAPGVFPMPDVPIIMLTGHVERWRVMEATRLGVNEFLKKPVSGKALLDRMLSILTRPRPMVRLGDYYGPEPRKLFAEHAADVPSPGIVPVAGARSRGAKPRRSRPEPAGMTEPDAAEADAPSPSQQSDHALLIASTSRFRLKCISVAPAANPAA